MRWAPASALLFSRHMVSVGFGLRLLRWSEGTCSNPPFGLGRRFCGTPNDSAGRAGRKAWRVQVHAKNLRPIRRDLPLQSVAGFVSSLETSVVFSVCVHELAWVNGWHTPCSTSASPAVLAVGSTRHLGGEKQVMGLIQMLYARNSEACFRFPRGLGFSMASVRMVARASALLPRVTLSFGASPFCW